MITVDLLVMRREDRFRTPPHVVERAELPAMPWRRSDAEATYRGMKRAARRRDYPKRIVVKP